MGALTEQLSRTPRTVRFTSTTLHRGNRKCGLKQRRSRRPRRNPREPKTFGWQNRRVSSDSYQWFPNSKDLLASVNGDIFVVHPNGKYDQITATEIDEEDPKLSPDGSNVLYRTSSNLYVMDLATKKSRQLTSDGTQRF